MGDGKTRDAGPALVVLAAGIGSRYGGLKQIDPVGPGGEFILEYSIYDALQAGFERVVFVISESIQDLFRERVGRTIEAQCDTDYVLQRLEDMPPGWTVPPGREKPWGTAHATWACRRVVDGPFAVINADDFYGRSAYQALARFFAGAPDPGDVYRYCMVGYTLEKTLTEHGHVARGVCEVDADGYLVGIRERTRVQLREGTAQHVVDGGAWVEIPAGGVASMNVWGFQPSLFAELGARFAQFLEKDTGNLQRAEFYLSEVIGALIREGRATVRVLPAGDRWFGVTYQEDKPRVEAAILELVRRGVYPDPLWAGSTME
jgi:dTDP-glucose pyrophosphorylase